MDLRQAVEMVKRMLTKEKIDRQLAGHTSSTPFMSIREGFNKKVTFDMTDGIEQKTDILMVMMGKLVMEDKGQNRAFKPQDYQSNRSRGQTRCKYNQRRSQDRFRSNNAYRGRPRYGQDYMEARQDIILIMEVVMGITQEVIKGMRGLIITIIEGKVIEVKITIGIGVGHMREGREV